MNKWKVEGHHGDHYVLCPTHKVRRGTRWAVINAETGDTREFPNHSEALAYADRAARTVEVTLPRVGRQRQIPVPDDYRNEPPISVSDHGTFIGASFTSQGLTQDVAIHPEESEPLALTLLALARRKEQTWDTLSATDVVMESSSTSP